MKILQRKWNNLKVENVKVSTASWIADISDKDSLVLDILIAKFSNAQDRSKVLKAKSKLRDTPLHDV